MNSAATVAGRRADDKGEEAGVSIGEGDKLINVVLLNGERLNVRVQASATGQDLYNIITDHLGLTETTFFGLMIIKDGEHEFLDFNEKLSKLAKFAPHLWKDDVSCNSSLVFTIFFRVKYYVENICLLQQQSTRHLYYLQLRKDVLEGGIYVHEETAMLLASYALQAEVGDYNQTLHGSDYFVPEHYLPQRAIAKLTASSIKKQLPSMHKTHTGLSDAQAEIEYLKEAQKLQEYGIIFNKVSKFKKDKRGGYSLGISVRGLIVYEERGIVKSPTFRHPWQNIKRMAFHRRRFYIEAHGDPETSKLVLYTCSYKKSRYLLKMCTSFYKFQMMMGMRLSNLKEYPKDGVVRMNGTVKTDETDSVAGEIPASTAAKPGQDSGVIQPPGIGPAIHLNGSTCTVQEDQPVQVSVHPVQLQKVDGSLGLNIIGGIELGGIYVKTMAPEGPASLSGKINIGDRILEINGQSLESLSRQEAVNILRTAPYVCTMLIESCVAAPATPNGKPAMPGSQSASAFYQPNRQQQMQPMMQRQPSLESQYSSMYQQFVPSQSHQIEDIASVSTLSIDKAKSEQNRCEATAWGRPLAINPAAVSTQIRQRAMRKKMMINEDACHEGKGDHIVGTSTGVGQTSVSEPKYSEKDNNPEDASPQIRQGAKTDTVSRIGITFFGRFQEKRDEHEAIITRDDRASKGDLHVLGSCNLEQEIATRDDSENMKNVSEGICQNEAPPVDEQAKLLGCTDQKGSQSEDSSVAGFFRKIQSFLFSPSPSKLKRNDESESSCCESDFDSEFSEMTSGSFNAGEIEAMREELDSLLLRDSPTPESAGLDDLSLGESPEVSVSRSKLLESEIKEVTCLGNTEKNLDALEGKINLKSDLGGDIDPGKLCKNDKLLELEAVEINKVKNIEVGEQQIACEGAKCQLNGEKSEAKSTAMGAAVDVEESKKACDHNESQMYTTVSGLVKVQKETTV